MGRPSEVSYTDGSMIVHSKESVKSGAVLTVAKNTIMCVYNPHSLEMTGNATQLYNGGLYGVVAYVIYGDAEVIVYQN